jgi:hypothetical protein
MWEQASIIMEIFAGILLAIHFLLRRTIHTRIDKWLLTRLQRKIAPRGRLRPSVLAIAAVPTLTILIGIAIWGFIKDFKGGAWQTGDLVVSYVILIAAIIAGILIIVLIVWILNKYFRNKTEPIYVVLISSFFIGIICVFLLSLLKISIIPITSFLLTFAVTTMLMGIWLSVMPLAQKFLTIGSGVLVRCGLTLFIIAKIIQLSLVS